jgi:hypothetical protein
MSLEQWELELREELGTSPRQTPPSPAPHPPAKSNAGGLVFLVVLLALGLGFALYHKRPDLFSTVEHWFKHDAPDQSAAQPPAPVVGPNPWEGAGVELKAIRNELGVLKAGQDRQQGQIDALDKRTKVQGERIILIGTIINDNAEGARRGDRDPLYLQYDWTIPREPRYLQVAPEDRPFLDKTVKPPGKQ